jgi:hypothetical protein
MSFDLQTNTTMPGPKMGPRPVDFDEQLIRQSPTFIKWSQLAIGEKLRYACREFIKGNGDDEERLMRRIMIARRNNIRDHQTLKRARLITSASSSNTSEELGGGDNPGSDLMQEELVVVEDDADVPQPPSMLEQAIALLPPPPTTRKGKTDAPTTIPAIAAGPASTTAPIIRKRRPSTLFSDAEVAKEMDVAAVEATRSFQAWKNLKDGEVFVYNQKYIKGQTNHEWLLKKNIWRRMRYRRENKKMVEKLRYIHSPTEPSRIGGGDGASVSSSLASQIIDKTLLSPTTLNHDNITINDHSALGNHIAESVSPENHYQPLPSPVSIPIPPSVASSNDVDITAAVQAAVKVAETYTQSAHYTNAMVHNALDTSANSAALDAAARLAAAASIDEEAVAAATAATVAAVDPSQFED